MVCQALESVGLLHIRPFWAFECPLISDHTALELPVSSFLQQWSHPLQLQPQNRPLPGLLLQFPDSAHCLQQEESSYPQTVFPVLSYNSPRIHEKVLKEYLSVQT